MELTNIERLILAKQLRILEALYPAEADTYRLDRIAIENGYTLFYADAAQSISDELCTHGCEDVVDILDMHRALLSAYRKLDGQTDISADRITFRGFDGNEETKQYLFAQYLIKDRGGWQELRLGAEGNGYNTHSPSLQKYHAMLNVWKSYGDTRHSLTEDQIRSIIEA